MTAPINKTMDRDDLLTPEAAAHVRGLNQLLRTLNDRGLCPTSWWGTLPKGGRRKSRWRQKLGNRLAGRPPELDLKTGVGYDNRGPDYSPLPGAYDDGWIPWYLYWEICWVLKNGPLPAPGLAVLDAGGTASLFTCYLASLGVTVHSVDLNESLVAHGNALARALGWDMHSYAMNLKSLEFADGFFDHAYAVCVFEHLDYQLKQQALREIARVLKPGGRLCLTFDYRNPAPNVVGVGPDRRPENQMSSPADLERSFLATGCFELVGNREFHDNRRSYLVHPGQGNAPYTFGSLFLRKSAV